MPYCLGILHHECMHPSGFSLFGKRCCQNYRRVQLHNRYLICILPPREVLGKLSFDIQNQFLSSIFLHRDSMRISNYAHNFVQRAYPRRDYRDHSYICSVSHGISNRFCTPWDEQFQSFLKGDQVCNIGPCHQGGCHSGTKIWGIPSFSFLKKSLFASEKGPRSFPRIILGSFR